MRRRGTKPKLSHSLIAKAEKLAKKGHFDITICQALGVTGTTWYRWLADGERVLLKEKTSVKYTPETEKLLCDFYYTIKKAQAEAEVELLGYIEKEAKLGTWQAAAWVLERKYRNRWGKEVQQGGDGDAALDRFLDGVDDIADEADEEYGEYVDPLEKQAEKEVKESE